ncbi:MAG: rod shape-determining protein RodA [Actinobacteria bacterium]|nr:rod shape-determining protein RodA [Actinomycetota bacterium]
MSVLQRGTDRPSAGFSVGRYLSNIDWILLVATLSLVAFGMAMIYSATHADRNISSPTQYVNDQALGLAAGLFALVVVSLVDFSWFVGLKRYLYWGNVALLGLTLVVGAERMGARRWIATPLFDVQTSELSKLLVVLALAALLAEGVELRGRLRFLLKSVAYVALPAFLVFVQPDLGTALVFVAVLGVMLLVWGIRWTHAALLGGGALLATTLVVRVLPQTFGLELLKPYQIQRLTVFLNPSQDTSGAAYQLSQSKIAVASGMFSGKGYMDGTQTNLNFLPAHHTDFIFSVIGEEFGFLGSAILLLLFLVVLWRAFRIASASKTLHGTLIASGVIAILLFQVFVNVGMTLGIMPITGIPLPFVSFGSSSLVVFLTAIGLLQSVHVHSRTALYGGRLRGDQHGPMAA